MYFKNSFGVTIFMPKNSASLKSFLLYVIINSLRIELRLPTRDRHTDLLNTVSISKTLLHVYRRGKDNPKNHRSHRPNNLLYPDTLLEQIHIPKQAARPQSIVYTIPAIRQYSDSTTTPVNSDNL